MALVHAECLGADSNERRQQVNGERNTKHFGEKTDKESSRKACALPFFWPARPGQKEKEQEEEDADRQNDRPVSIPLIKRHKFFREYRPCSRSPGDQTLSGQQMITTCIVTRAIFTIRSVFFAFLDSSRKPRRLVFQQKKAGQTGQNHCCTKRLRSGNFPSKNRRIAAEKLYEKPRESISGKIRQQDSPIGLMLLSRFPHEEKHGKMDDHFINLDRMK